MACKGKGGKKGKGGRKQKDEIRFNEISRQIDRGLNWFKNRR